MIINLTQFHLFFAAFLPRAVQGGAAGAVHPSGGRLLEASRRDGAALLEELGSSLDGLLDREAEERLERHGPNTVAHEARKSALRRLSDHFFTNPINVLLTGLAAISLIMGDGEAAAIIGLMVLLSVLLSFIQETRSSNAAERLRAMVSTTATVVRKDKVLGVDEEVIRLFEVNLRRKGPERKEIPLAELVPGDIVHLSAGDMVPADVRILSAKDLFVNQASLTGEAMPVEKFAGQASSGSVLELPNIAFMGTNVVSGTATAVVVLTGSATYFGSVAAAVSGQRPLTNFDRGVKRFAWLMIRFMAVMVPLVFLINGFSKGNWIEALLFALAVAVGLAPEMLPMIVTINLAKGAIAMARKKVIVKRLNAIQNFGAMDVLCTDKTGTLTQDKIFLERHVDINGEESERVLDFAYLNSYYQTGLKNLLDVAVLEHGELHDALRVDTVYRKVDEIPFDFRRRRMSVVVEKEQERHVLVCKGAVEEVFSVCGRAESEEGHIELIPEHLEQLRQVTRELNEDGFRVIAVAYREFDPRHGPYSLADEADLILVGYIAFLDPPKDSAADAIAVLREHGVAVKVLTGDNDIVTAKVCREVGLDVAHVVLGSELEPLDDAALAEVAEKATVFAKLSPEQKARVISALQRKGHAVGFLGDGINDGPALRVADVGISVDTAVDIAKESADIILLEKSLMVLEEGVLEGRRVFGNIIKYIRMGASSNFGNMFSVLGASAFLPFLPMAPVQVLVNNLFYDFSQTAVATDHVDDEYVSAPRQWDIGSIARFMLFIGPISSIFDYATYFTLLYAFDGWHQPHLFQTGWFVESLLSQTLVVHVLRTGKLPWVQSRASLPLTLTTAAICAGGAWLPFSPFGRALGFVPLPGGYWLALAVILAAYLMLTQGVKQWLVRRYGLG